MSCYGPWPAVAVWRRRGTWLATDPGGPQRRQKITEFEVDDLACRIAHIIPRGDGADGTFNPEAFLEPKELRKISDFILYGIVAADEALKDSAGSRRPRKSAAPPA